MKLVIAFLFYFGVAYTTWLVATLLWFRVGRALKVPGQTTLESYYAFRSLFFFLVGVVLSGTGCFFAANWAYRATEAKMGAFFGVVAGGLAAIICGLFFLGLLGAIVMGADRSKRHRQPSRITDEEPGKSPTVEDAGSRPA